MSVVERGLGRHALGLALGAHGARVDAVREPRQPQALGAEPAHQLGLVGALQVGDDAKALARERRAHRLADAPDEGHRPGRQERRRLGAAEHREAARLVEIGGELGEELVLGQPDRHRDADLVLDRAGEARRAISPASGRAAARCRRDRETPRRSTAARPAASARASARAPRGRRAAYFAMSGGTTVGVRAQPPRLEHRHGRADAVGARDVAGGRHHAALAAADDQRLVARATGRRASRSRRRRRRSRHARWRARSSSGWRTSRGEPQAGQRAARSGTSSRQSRQKPAMERFPRALSASGAGSP